MASLAAPAPRPTPRDQALRVLRAASTARWLVADLGHARLGAYELGQAERAEELDLLLAQAAHVEARLAELGRRELEVARG